MFWKSGHLDGAVNRDGVSLIGMTGARLGLAALISFVILSLLCLRENFFDESYFTRWYARVESATLAASLIQPPGGELRLTHGDGLAHYFSPITRDAYAFRIWDQRGQIVASANERLFIGISPIAGDSAAKPDYWQQKFGDGWFEFLAGKRVVLDGKPVWIEIATRGDPAGMRYRALAHDFLHDVVQPLLPAFLVAFFLSLWSLRRALRPVMVAAEAAEHLEPSAEGGRVLRLPTSNLPREVATLADAVNKLLSRVGELISSQSDFIGRAAHQLRMPLATMLLEVNKIEGPAARQLEQDIQDMGETVERLLELARMQGMSVLDRGDLDLDSLAQDVVMDLQPMAEQRGGVITIVDCGANVVSGDYLTMREALRNLVSNAILHHPGRPDVRVVCGPGAQISVEDDGPGLTGISPSRLFEPFSRGQGNAGGVGLGLAIVKAVVDLHRGRVMVGRSSRGGAKFSILLADSDGPESNFNPSPRPKSTKAAAAAALT